ncbi:MAG: hypothetical protein ACLQDL_15070 [Spirochaetia bacterium]
MRSRVLLIFPFLLLLALRAGADAPEATRVIGMELKSAVDAFGLPQSMFSFRGTEEARDDVVFYYPDHIYLFWYKDRVWQVRFDRRSTAGFHGLSPGMTRQEVEGAVKERPLVASGDSLYFDLDTDSFPVRVRLVFAGSDLSDIYVYRSDF